MNTRNFNKQGISLIVLVITIIVMIILATSVVITLNNSGIIDKANEAVEATNLAQVRDLAKMLWADAYLDKTIPKDQIEGVVLAKLKEAIGESNFSKYTITVTASGINVEKKKDPAPVITLDSELSEDSTNPTVATGTSYTLTGKVTDEKGVKSLTVNGVAVPVAQDGTWSTTLTLVKDKLTEVTMIATDTSGNTTTKTGYVGYITYINFTITADNRHKVGYDANAATLDLEIPETFYDEEEGKWKVVTRISDSAFERCSNLRSVVIPNSVSHIGSKAFRSCTILENITLPEAGVHISTYAFSWCSSLASLDIPGNAFIDKYSFAWSGLVNLTINEGPTWITGQVFYECHSLTNVYLPVSLTMLDYEVFGLCENITNVYYAGTLVEWVLIDIFAGNTYLTNATLHLKDADVSIVEIPSGVSAIRSSAFEGRQSITSVTLPDSVTTIGARAFRSCTSLASVNLGAGVQTISDRAFSGCTSLTSIVIPSSVTKIDTNAFWGCTGLTSIAFAGTVEQWNAITKGGTGSSAWNYNVPATVVSCSDGDVAL